MKKNTSTIQKIGWGIFIIGAVYMFGVGWLYSRRMVPAANQLGSEAYIKIIINWLPDRIKSRMRRMGEFYEFTQYKNKEEKLK